MIAANLPGYSSSGDDVHPLKDIAVAPNGTAWTAVNNRDDIPYPFHKAYGGYKTRSARPSRLT